MIKSPVCAYCSSIIRFPGYQFCRNIKNLSGYCSTVSEMPPEPAIIITKGIGEGKGRKAVLMPVKRILFWAGVPLRLLIGAIAWVGDMLLEGSSSTNWYYLVHYGLVCGLANVLPHECLCVAGCTVSGLCPVHGDYRRRVPS